MSFHAKGSTDIKSECHGTLTVNESLLHQQSLFTSLHYPYPSQWLQMKSPYLHVPYIFFTEYYTVTYGSQPATIHNYACQFQSMPHGGGVLMYVHNCLSYKVIVKGPATLEFLVLSVCKYFCKLCVRLFYRPPSSPVSVLDNFYTVLEGLDPSYFSNFVLLGDFNIDFYNPHSHQHCKLTDVMHAFSLTQAVGEALHTTPTGKETMIDWALVSQMTKLRHCAVIPPIANSDHNGLLLQWIWKLPVNQTRLKPRQIWRCAQGDFERAKDMLSSVDWEQLIDPTDVNQSC